MKKIIFLLIAVLFSYTANAQTMQVRADSVIANKLKVKSLGVGLVKTSTIGNASTAISTDITAYALTSIPADTTAIAFTSSSTILNSFANIQRRLNDNAQNHNLNSDLTAGISTSILVLGNSTEKDTITWPYKWLKLLNAKYTNYNIKCNVWNTGTQDYGLYPEFYLRGSATNHYANIVTSGLYFPYQQVPLSGGDVEIRCFINATNYANGSTQHLIGKYKSGVATNVRLAITSTGLLQLIWAPSPDGSVQVLKNSTVTLPSVGITNGTDLWVRATLSVNNGSSGSDVKFYYSTTNSSYTQLGSTVTTAGVTNVYTGDTLNYEIGVNTPNLNQFVGKFYYAEIRDGIGGPIVTPPLIDSWIRYSSTAVTFVGNPVLSMYIGGQSGITIQGLQDPTRVKKMIPLEQFSAVLITNGHNDSLNFGGTYIKLWDSWLSIIRSRVTTGDIFVVNENPRVSPSNLIYEQAKRQGEINAWGYKNGLKNINAFKAFIQCPNYPKLIQGDGIHPTFGNSGGAQFWAQIVYNILN